VRDYGKVYAAEEVENRFHVFRANLDFIMAHNARSDTTFRVGVNQFADLNLDEFKATHTGTNAKADPLARRSTRTPKLPDTWDWRTMGAVLAVQDQGQCGSCWAFTTTDSISGIWAQRTGLLIELSAQQVVDCSGPEGNQGCNGGLVTQAMQYAMDNKGLCEWATYQYTATTGNCNTNCTNVARIDSYSNVAQGDEKGLQQAVYQQVVSTAVDVTSAFQFYKSGVFDDPTCTTQLNHGMTVIGWGHVASGGADVPYWQLRNMWSQNWGENGYIRVVRGKNMCGLAESASYPNLKL